jgi:hypothetical protein
MSELDFLISKAKNDLFRLGAAGKAKNGKLKATHKEHAVGSKKADEVRASRAKMRDTERESHGAPRASKHAHNARTDSATGM